VKNTHVSRVRGGGLYFPYIIVQLAMIIKTQKHTYTHVDDMFIGVLQVLEYNRVNAMHANPHAYRYEQWRSQNFLKGEGTTKKIK
jgi:hypothetical protein